MLNLYLYTVGETEEYRTRYAVPYLSDAITGAALALLAEYPEAHASDRRQFYFLTDGVSALLVRRFLPTVTVGGRILVERADFIAAGVRPFATLEGVASSDATALEAVLPELCPHLVEQGIRESLAVVDGLRGQVVTTTLGELQSVGRPYDNYYTLERVYVGEACP